MTIRPHAAALVLALTLLAGCRTKGGRLRIPMPGPVRVDWQEQRRDPDPTRPLGAERTDNPWLEVTGEPPLTREEQIPVTIAARIAATLASILSGNGFVIDWVDDW